MIYAYLLAALAIGVSPAAPTEPVAPATSASLTTSAELAPVIAGLSRAEALRSIFTTAIEPHASFGEDGGGDQDASDCVFSGVQQVYRFSGPNVETLSMEAEDITCKDNTTRRKITWTITTTDMMDVITVKEKYSPSGQYTCESVSEHEVDPRIVSIQTYVQYPDGHCTGAGDECCVPISSTTVREPHPHGGFDDEVPGFDVTLPYVCPNGEIGEADYFEWYNRTCYALVTTTSYLRIGDCGPTELCEPQITDRKVIDYSDGPHHILESTDCD